MTKEEVEISSPKNLYVEYLKIINEIEYTSREIDVIACILGGRSSKKIANFLDIAPKTVETHIHNVMLKLGCNSREYILDYFEKSSKNRLLNAHYTLLLLNLAFENALKRVVLLTKKYSPTCYFYNENKKLNEAWLSLLIKKHLMLVNVNVISINGTKHFVSEIKPNHLLIYFSSQNPKDKSYKTNLACSNLFSGFSNLIVVIENGRNQSNRDMQTTDQIDFKDIEQYYLFVFRVLEKLYPQISFEGVISAFYSEWKELVNIPITVIKEQVNTASSINDMLNVSKTYYHHNWLLFIGLSLLSISLLVYNHFTTKNLLINMYEEVTENWITSYEPHINQAIEYAEFYQLRGNFLDVYRAKEIKSKVEKLFPLIEKDIEVVEKEITTIEDSLLIIDPFNYLLKNRLLDYLKWQAKRLMIASSFNELSKLVDKEDFSSAIKQIEENIFVKINDMLKSNSEQDLVKLSKLLVIATNIGAVAKRKFIEKTVVDNKEYKLRINDVYNELVFSLANYDSMNYITHLLSHHLKILLAQEEQNLKEKTKQEDDAEKHLAVCSDKSPKEPLVLGAQAMHYAQKNEFEKAFIAFNTALDLQPNNVGMLHNRAELYLNLASKKYNLEYYRKAYNDAKKANFLKPNDCDIIKLLVWSTFFINGCNDARDLYKNTYFPLCVDSRDAWEDVSAVRTNADSFLNEIINVHCK